MSLKDDHKQVIAELKTKLNATAVDPKAVLAVVDRADRIMADMRQKLSMSTENALRAITERDNRAQSQAAAEKRVTELTDELHALKQRQQGDAVRPVLATVSQLRTQLEEQGRQKCVGKQFILQAGTGSGKKAMLYSRCNDEVLIRAELLQLFDQYQTQKVIAADDHVDACYDIDPTYTVHELLDSYADRPDDLVALDTRRRQLHAKPSLWNFVEVSLPPGTVWTPEHRMRRDGRL